MIRNLAWLMHILFPAALLSTLLVLVRLFRERHGNRPAPAFYLTLCGLYCLSRHCSSHSS